MSIPEIGKNSEPIINSNSNNNAAAKQDTSKSIFSKYDLYKDGKIDAEDQRIALTKCVSKLYQKLQKNMNMQAIELISKFSKTFKDILTNGQRQNINEIDLQLENMLEKTGNNIINLISNGNDRSKEFKSHKDFLKSKDLKAGDYYVSEKGYIYQYNGEGKNWSVYDGANLKRTN